MHPIDALLGLLVPPTCWACGARARHREPLCLACRAELRWLDDQPVELAGVDVWAPVAYDGPARALVSGLKFRGAVGLAEPMAAQIAANAPTLLRPPALLVPVPLHPARARARGYNQAERLAAALGRRTGMCVVDCLCRQGAGGRQVGRGRGERLVALEGSIRRRSGARVPERVVLVDDVVTTGGTVAACTGALHAGGATDVAAVAYARTPSR